MSASSLCAVPAASDEKNDPLPRWGRVCDWGMRPVVSLLFNRTTVQYFGCRPCRTRSQHFFDVKKFPAVRGFVALSVDDAPCHAGQNSMLLAVLALLRRYEAAATFMLMGSCVPGHETGLVSLLRAGHELGNHCMLDRPYANDCLADFGADVDACSGAIQALQRSAGVAEGVDWFRAPHGMFTEAMADAVQSRGLTNVMCDTYAACPIISDGAFIGKNLARQASHGSIVLIHMPEQGYREWCFEGLASLLVGLRRKGLRVVTISELSSRATTGAREVGTKIKRTASEFTAAPL